MTVVKEEIEKKITYPIAEVFTSPQGEGCYAGQMQTFIRLAGCTVGKPYPKQVRDRKGLPIYTEKCTLYDGREFACDTDYRRHEKLTSSAILERIPSGVDHVCITGGEPLMHDLSLLITHLHGIGRTVHIETSGTIAIALDPDVWVTVSPKMGVLWNMIERANELKILVNKDFNLRVPLSHDIGSFDLTTLALRKPVFLQPVNEEHTVNTDNLKRCMEWQKKYPQFRVCVQMHKVLSTILHEEVR
jgi:7-carboxy-7-deazaguanine synthase